MNDSKMAEELYRLKEDMRQNESELESLENSDCRTKDILRIRNSIKTLLQRGASKDEILEAVKDGLQTPRVEE